MKARGAAGELKKRWGWFSLFGSPQRAQRSQRQCYFNFASFEFCCHLAALSGSGGRKIEERMGKCSEFETNLKNIFLFPDKHLLIN